MNEGPKKSYPHRLLSQTLWELNMGANIFAEFCGITPEQMYRTLALRETPQRRDLEKDTAIRIQFQSMTGKCWEELFPDSLHELLTELRTLFVSSKGNVSTLIMDRATECGFIPQAVATPLDELIQSEDVLQAQKIIDHVLSSLGSKEEKVIRMRFMQGLTLEECGKEMRLTRDRIRQIEAVALRKMRHPTRIRQLTEAFYYYC